MAHHNHFHRRHAAAREDQHMKDVAAPLEARNPQDAVVSVVFVTAAPTFNGPIAGFTTIAPGPRGGQPRPNSSSQSNNQQQGGSRKDDDNNNQSQQQQPSQQQQQQQQPTQTAQETRRPVSSVADPVSTESTGSSSSSSSATSTASTSSSSGSSTPTTATTALSTPSSSSTLLSPSAASATASAEPAQGAQPGMSGGAKAGIAFGVLLAVGALLALLLVFYRRKKAKQAAYAKTADEKSALADNGATFGTARPVSSRSARTASTAPRLSLRPVTQFSPALNGEGRKSVGNPLAMRGGAGANRGLSPNAGAANGPAVDPSNPFGIHAESSSPAQPQMSSVGPGDSDGSRGPGPQGVVGAAPDGGAGAAAGVGAGAGVAAGAGAGAGAGLVAAGAAGAAGAALGVTAAQRSNNSSADNLSRPVTPDAQQARAPPSPTASEFSATSTQAGAAAAGGPGAPGGPVHRVQLDFKPSMEDELELRAGQLVRMLHEYDDGWALCIRLDRSQQGVAPRTCLSTRPVKPRMPPQGGPRGPPQGMRGPPGRGPPMGPPNGRPMSPAGGRQNPRPRPNQGYPTGRQSPGPQGMPQQRPASPGMHSQPAYASPPAPLTPGGGRNSPGPWQGGMAPGGGRSRSNSSSLQGNGPSRGQPGPSRMSPGPTAPHDVPATLRPATAQPGAEGLRVARKPAPGQAM
ncbi:MAG: hypothetical protein M1832_000448 [Thelocarpon impressellum]|nr:MAG: hypothetical protein M1832_000448 [Thelocarpon impressellum]